MTRHAELLWALVAKEFKVRYKNTALGFLWSVANPVAFALVFYFVFVHVLRNPTPNYLVFLLAGLFPWHCTASALSGAPTVYLGNAGLVKKVYFPRILLPMAALGNNVVHFLLVIVVAVPVLLVAGQPPSLAWLWAVPALLVVQCAVTLGLALILSSLNVYFRDLAELTAIFVQLLFFMTPVLYSETALPEKVRAILQFNPMYWIIPPWRELVLSGRMSGAGLGVGAAVGAAVLLLGYGVHRRMEGGLAEQL